MITPHYGKPGAIWPKPDPPRTLVVTLDPAMERLTEPMGNLEWRTVDRGDDCDRLRERHLLLQRAIDSRLARAARRSRRERKSDEF